MDIWIMYDTFLFISYLPYLYYETEDDVITNRNVREIIIIYAVRTRYNN